jgi:L-fuculose-phosphate aldolase
MHLRDVKDDIVEVGRRLWQRGYVAANDGNISVRVENDRLVATPTGVSKGFLTPDTLILTDMDGRLVQGDRQPSSELKMHIAVYRNRPDVKAVVHAHPPVATAFSVAGMALDKCVLPESVLTLGGVPTVPYATPSTDEFPQGLVPYISRSDAVLLANHGAVTWANNLETAYFRMETLEHTATIIHHAMLLGKVNLLSQQDVEKLGRVRKNIGITGRALPCEAGDTCKSTQGQVSRLDPEDERLVETVTRAVTEILGSKS